MSPEATVTKATLDMRTAGVFWLRGNPQGLMFWGGWNSGEYMEICQPVFPVGVLNFELINAGIDVSILAVDWLG